MSKYRKDQHLSFEEYLLDRYLLRYRVCLKRKGELEKRRKEILYEFSNPLSGMNYDGMPKAMSISQGSAKLTFKLDEIDTQILAETERSAEFCEGCIFLIGFLADGSEKLVLEAKYIDGKRWGEIAKNYSMSRSKAIRHWRQGLRELLKMWEVQDILDEYVKGDEDA